MTQTNCRPLCKQGVSVYMNYRITVPFTQVANCVLVDTNISLGAKGLFAYIYSKPEYWQFSSERMEKECKESAKVIRRILRELEKSGYVRRQKLVSGKVNFYTSFDKEPPYPKGEVAQKGKKPKRVSITNTDEESNNKEEIKIPTAKRRVLSFRKLGTEERVQEEPFKMEESIANLKRSPHRHVQFIGEYFEEKKLAFTDKKQFDIAFKRHLKDASQLAAFSDKQIGDATTTAEKDYPDYTLGTLVKILTR